MKLIRVFILSFVSLNSVVAYSSVATEFFTKQKEILILAREVSPFIAAHACTYVLKKEIYKDFLQHLNPKKLYQELKSFNKPKEEYLKSVPPIKMQNRFQAELFSSLMAKGKSLTRASFDYSLNRSFLSIANPNPVELLNLRSYFIDSVIASNEFKSELSRCQQIFQYENEELFQNLNDSAKFMNEVGFIVGQVSSMGISGLGFYRLVNLLPKAYKFGLTTFTISISAWLSYEILSPAIKVLDKIQDYDPTLEKQEISDYIDKHQWANLYNACIDLRDSHIKYIESESDQNLQAYRENIELLKKRKKDILFILNEYLSNENFLNNDEKVTLELLFYISAQIN